MSTFKGLALGWGKPLVGFSTLHALCRSVDAPEGSLICACLDARKGEVYAAVYRLGSTPVDDVAVLPPMAVEARALSEQIAALKEPVRRAGDGWTRYPAELSTVATENGAWNSSAPSMSALAACALHRLPAGDVLETLEPLYVRRSYADLSLAQKKKEAP